VYVCVFKRDVMLRGKLYKINFVLESKQLFIIIIEYEIDCQSNFTNYKVKGKFGSSVTGF